MQKRFSARLMFRLSLLTICVLTSLAATVRAQTPTAEQIQIFQNLPPVLQQSIIEAMGKNGTGMPGTSSSSRTRTDRQMMFPDVVKRGSRKEGDDDDQTDSFGAPRIPRIKPQDTILLSLE